MSSWQRIRTYTYIFNKEQTRHYNRTGPEQMLHPTNEIQNKMHMHLNIASFGFYMCAGVLFMH